jgi:hypothetical protein
MSLNENAFEDVERDPTAIGQAVGVIVLAAVAAGIGNIFRGAIGAAIIWLVGTKLFPEPATKADFQETFRVLGFAYSPGLVAVIAIIPFLGVLLSFLISLWQIAALVVAVKAVFDYTTLGKAVIVVIVGWLIGMCLAALLLFPVMGGMYFLSR